MKKTTLGTASSLALIAACAGLVPAMASAQTAQTAATPSDSNVVVVTGLRKSLQSAITIKKNASGVVDAINAEDIGKFPDTNLAESIQRIPGVTIDRSNGEGARVTVRGFGPEYNLVTLNGRSMPGGISSSSQSASRSYDFANLSADGITGVNVYKTGRADTPTGGIGSTIDIRTARPFDYKTMQATLQVKATDDTTTKGTRLTPEISGLFSDTFAGGKLGFLVNGNYSERNSRLEQVFIGAWLPNVVPNSGANIVSHNTNPDGNTWAPQNENFLYTDHLRTRLNGQAVLQFRPVDSVVMTADYTYTLYRETAQNHEAGAWFTYGGDLHNATINEHGTVANFEDAGADLSFQDSNDKFRNENKSAGFNVKWDASDSLTFTLDASDSTAVSGHGADGNNAFALIGFLSATPGYGDSIFSAKTFCTCNLDIPKTTYTFTPGHSWDSLTTANLAGLFAEDNANYFRTEIKQVRADGLWRNRSDSGLKSLKFGVSDTRFTTAARSWQDQLSLGFYGDTGSLTIPLTKVGMDGLFSPFSGGGATSVPYMYTYKLDDLVKASASHYGWQWGIPATPLNDDHIAEEVKAAYAQADFDTDFNGMRFKALAGLRYEHTDVTANSLVQVPAAIVQTSATEYFTQMASGSSFSNVKRKYDEFLPSLDTSLAIRDDFIVRASYSRTITRSDLTAMVGTEAFSNDPKPGARTISAGNPGLLPYASDNIDLTAEWYPNKDTYFTVNYFSKNVSNFLTTSTSDVQVAGLTDPALGARAQLARTELAAHGNSNPSSQDIFMQMTADAGTSSITGDATDPVITWQETKPTNANTVQVHGFELAAQHVFGDTGFGFQANVSLPAGGAHFNNAQIGNQFALPGLSKSYNLVLFYDKKGIQGRVAYTHRDEFLSAIGQLYVANEPQYTEAYGQLDASASYDFTPHLSVFFDGINLTNSSLRIHGRYTEQLVSAQVYKARYQVGVKYKF
ncbi:TonB-dependent receptor [Asticcacaulis solisilvae]|uniref:TonB-dependent receptor n=1 Tax=Asticcacaulis solisilvae TaxID=1217274 RepID=UPI003FD6F471